MFEVSYETTFCATHRLTDGGRPIEPLHGHDWRVEVVAQYFFEEVRKGLGEEGRGLVRVRVWEAPGCSATYRP